MEKKTYTLEHLDCANCAAKIEAKFNSLAQVQEAVIIFPTRQLRLTAEDPDALIPQLQSIARTVEDGVVILPGNDTSCHHGECCCGHEHHHEHHHDHHHHHHHDHKEANELPGILLGAGLFAGGLVLHALLPALWLQIPVFVFAYLILGWRVIATAGRNLLKGHVFDENFLMSLATIGAFAIGEFSEAVGVMLFFRVGEHFEHKAVEHSRKSIMDAVDLRPEVVTLLSGETVLAEQAKVGDILLIRPGDRIPLDGTVISGDSRIDTAPITGEPVPVAVHPGSPVISGCVNTQGLLTVEVHKTLSDSMVTRILDSVENAAASKPKIDRFITRFARVYTPIVVVLAAATAVIPSLFTGNWSYWVYTALSFLVMSCPCALVLSVPLAFFSGIGTGSKKGILFKGGLSIEALAGIKIVVMDKTGTVTQGKFAVQMADPHLLALCASCEQYSTHPIAQSIVAAAKEQEISLQQPDDILEIPGHGIQAVLNGRKILCGNEKLLAAKGISCPSCSNPGGTRIHIAEDGTYLGSILIADAIKSDAKAAISRLHSQDIATAMLTGDQLSVAKSVAKELGVQEIHAQLLPQDKLTKLQDIRARKGAAMFVGDGINDAPVLAGADVGAAMGSGADAAIEAADVVFMTSSVSAIPEAVDIARQTRRIAWQNVIFALSVKAIVMLLGLMGHASMWAAVFADSGVAMLCVLNSVRLLQRKL